MYGEDAVGKLFLSLAGSGQLWVQGLPGTASGGQEPSEGHAKAECDKRPTVGNWWQVLFVTLRVGVGRP